MSVILSVEAVFDLYQELGNKVKFLDATFCMPGSHDMRRQIFEQYRLPNASFFDIDLIADQSVELPHMLPTSEVFFGAVAEMGIDEESQVVIYAQEHVAMAACRAWWMFHAYGYNNVFVMDGSLRHWMDKGFPLSEIAEVSSPAVAQGQNGVEPQCVVSLEYLSKNLDDLFVVDARGAERFAGSVAEPRAGLRSGHIPGSHNLPFVQFFDPYGGFVSGERREALVKKIFDEAGSRRVVSTCGSGVTACVLAVVAADSGLGDVSVYDGSWVEYGDEQNNMPINAD